MSHTQSPWMWHASKHEDGRNDGSVIHLERPGMAHCVCKAPQYQSDEQWEADAKLITASPELLEACKKARTCNIPDYVDDLLKKAIAKAIGKEQS